MGPDGEAQQVPVLLRDLGVFDRNFQQNLASDIFDGNADAVRFSCKIERVLAQHRPKRVSSFSRPGATARSRICAGSTIANVVAYASIHDMIVSAVFLSPYKMQLMNAKNNAMNM